MTYEEIRNCLHQKYIQPTIDNNGDFVGVEIEIPIMNLDKQPVDFTVVHTLTGDFAKQFGFNVIGEDEDGNVFSLQNGKNGDILSFDCSYNNLELSFGKEKSLHTVWERFRIYYAYIQSELGKHNCTLSGMGINPYRNYNRNVPIPNGRYRMLFHHLSSYKKYYSTPMFFHRKPDFGMFSSAAQVQLDVNYDELPLTLNTFSKLEPIKALLFSNSVLLGDNEEILCYRDIFWESSTQGLNPHNIGMYSEEFSGIEDIINYIETTSIFCAERDGKYINFKPLNIVEYLQSEKIEGEYFEKGEYKKITFTPEKDDLKYLRTYKFEDLTFRGTVEYRSVCCQPISECMAFAAFQLGLKHNLKALADILDNDNVIYHHGYNATELRKLLIQNTIPKFINEDELYSLARNITDLAADGLKKRGLGEEEFLAPVYERISNRTNPAKYMLEQLKSGVDIEEIIIEYANTNPSSPC